MNKQTTGGIYTLGVSARDLKSIRRFFHFPYHVWFYKLKGRSLNDYLINAFI